MEKFQKAARPITFSLPNAQTTELNTSCFSARFPLPFQSHHDPLVVLGTMTRKKKAELGLANSNVT